MSEFQSFAALTPELATKVEALMRELGVDGNSVEWFADTARLCGVGLVDPARTRFLVDETVYAGALNRGKHWRELAEAREPVPMVLHCPQCKAQHVDRPEPDKGWTNPPHRTHTCHACGWHWRPADIATVGVETIATRGRLDGTYTMVAETGEPPADG